MAPSTADDVTTGEEGWTARIVAQLAPVVAGRGPQIDELGRLPDDVVAAMHASGLFRTWIPVEFGGAGRTVGEGLALIEALSRLDGSLGWVTMINITTTCLAGSLDRETARSVFSDPHVVAGGTTAPSGQATDVPGGVQLRGHWSWGSGIHNAGWMACGAMLDGDRPRPVLALVPVSDLEVLDTWHVMGLRGTGSTDYRTEGVFVPQGRVLDLGRAAPWSDLPIHRFAIFGLLALAVSSVAAGLGRRALDEFRSLAGERALFGTGHLVAADPVAQVAYARAEAAVRAAIAWRDAVVADAWLEATSGPLSMETRRSLRLASTHLADSARKAVELLWEHAGAGVVHEREPLQRVLRDVHVVSQHFRVAARTWEMCGALALGQRFDGQL